MRDKLQQNVYFLMGAHDAARHVTGGHPQKISNLARIFCEMTGFPV
jgi:hypothetical protein